jgi:hypothetical protein
MKKMKREYLIEYEDGSMGIEMLEEQEVNNDDFVDCIILDLKEIKKTISKHEKRKVKK